MGLPKPRGNSQGRQGRPTATLAWLVGGAISSGIWPLAGANILLFYKAVLRLGWKSSLASCADVVPHMMQAMKGSVAQLCAPWLPWWNVRGSDGRSL